MKKSITRTKQQNERRKKEQQQRRTRNKEGRAGLAEMKIPDWTVGVDLGDEESYYCVLDQDGEVAPEGNVKSTGEGLGALLEKLPRSRVVMEAGTHSPWASRCAQQRGHEVIVANTRRVRLIALAYVLTIENPQRFMPRADVAILKTFHQC